MELPPDGSEDRRLLFAAGASLRMRPAARDNSFPKGRT